MKVSMALVMVCAGALVMWSLTTRKRMNKYTYTRSTEDGGIFAEWVKRNAIKNPPSARPVENGLFAQRFDREELIKRAEARMRKLYDENSDQ